MPVRPQSREFTNATMPVYRTLEGAIGDTPPVRLRRIPGAAQVGRGNVIRAKLADRACRPVRPVRPRATAPTMTGCLDFGAITLV